MALPVIETPKYELTIPSNGEKIEFRPYLVKEEKILIIAMESKDTSQMVRAVRDVISACTFNKVNVDDLALFDLEYIFLKLRSTSVGAISELKMKCGECEQFTEVSVNIDEVGVEGDVTKERTIPITNDVGVVMKFPTVKGALMSGGATDDAYATIIGTIIASIDTIYDADNIYSASDYKREELIDFIESLNQEQFTKINTFFEGMPALSHNVEFDCQSCGHHNDVELKGLQSFF